MSQRLQSIFFFVSALLFAMLFFLPLAEYLGDTNILRFNAYGVESLLPDGEIPFGKWFALPILVLTVTAVLLSGYVAYGLHKAIKLNDFVRLHSVARINVVIIVAWIALVFAYYIRAVGLSINVMQPEYKVGAFLPLAALIFALLGAMGLRRDIKRVRSTDRIR